MSTILNTLGKFNYSYPITSKCFPILLFFINYKFFPLTIVIMILQHKFIGFNSNFEPYSNDANIITHENKLPTLTIIANTYKESGKFEGTYLAKYMYEIHKKLYYFIPFVKYITRYKDDSIHIPIDYSLEMVEKLNAYHTWQRQKFGKVKYFLSKKDYIFLHILPDIHNCRELGGLSTLFGCTTLIKNIHGNIKILRILDWPSYGLMGNYTLLIIRNINGVVTKSITNPFLTGATTIFTDKMFFQMNVARGEDKIISYTIPSLIMNRILAENVTQLSYISNFLQATYPYNLIACDGKNVKVFGPCYEKQGQNVYNIFAVANLGFKHNIQHDHHNSIARCERMIELGQKHDDLFNCAKDDLVNRFDTQFVALFEFNNGSLEKASCKVSNIFAGNKIKILSIE